MKKEKPTEQHKVFNRQIVLFFAVFIILLIFSISSFLSNENDIALFLFVGAFFVSLGMFLSPVYFIFSSKLLTAVWVLRFKKTIHWSSDNNIIECKLFSAVDDLAHYEIMYSYNYKGKHMVRQFDLPRNKRTRKYIEKYAKHKIV
jgi:glucose-6-phosphate-specific signal transduction histidine kinase